MTTRLATPIAALLLAAFAPSALAAPQAAERVASPAATAGPAVAATRLGGLEATRAISLRRSSVADASPVVGAVAIDGVDGAEIAAALLARPAGSRVLVTANLIAGLVGNPRDRVVVNGRITDHPSPWFDAGIAETAPRFKRLADELNRLGAVPEALIVVGDHDLLAESVAGGGDRRWMALRNDHRFATVRSKNFHLEGVIAPGGEQWNRWNEFVQSQVSAALELVVQDTLGALFPSIELAWYQPATAGASAPASAPAARLGAATVLRFSAPFGGATTDPLAAWSAVAAEMQRSATAAAEAPLLPVVLPRSHAGSRTERSAISGTPLWDELVRHLALRGGGTILLDDRAIRDRQVEARDDRALAAILAEVAAVAAEFAGGGSHLAGNDHLGTMVRSPSGDRLLRITLAPGIASAWIDLDGERLLVSADPGGQGVWLRVAADGSIESKRSIETASLGERAGSGRSPAGSPRGDGGAAVTIVGDWSTSGLGDLNGDGVVDGADLAIFLATQGVNLTDLNGDGVVDGADLAILLARPGFDGVDLANWLAGAGPDGWTGAPYGDLDGSGTIDGADLAIRLANAFPPGGWGGQPYGDLDGDGAIGGADLAIWLAGVGAGGGGDVVKVTVATGGGEQSPPQIEIFPITPEPASGGEQTSPTAQGGVASAGGGPGAYWVASWADTPPGLDHVVPMVWLRGNRVNDQSGGALARFRPEIVASELQQLPPGRRVVFPWRYRNSTVWMPTEGSSIRGHPLDRVQAPDGSGFLDTPSPFLDHATAAIRGELIPFMQQVQALGGQVDYLIVDDESNGWLSGWHLSTPQIGQIMEDPRFDTMLMPNGQTPRQMMGSTVAAQVRHQQHRPAMYRWNAMMDHLFHHYLNQALFDPLRELFPNLQASNYPGFVSQTDEAAPDYNGHRQWGDSRFGTHSAFNAYGTIRQLSQHWSIDPADPTRIMLGAGGSGPIPASSWSSLLVDLNRARSIARSSSRGFHTWIADPAWGPVVNGQQIHYHQAHGGAGHYWENVYHQALSGSRLLLFWTSLAPGFGVVGTESPEQRQVRWDRVRQLDAAIEELNQRTHRQFVEPIQVGRLAWNTPHILSGGARPDGSAVWRISVRSDVESVRIEPGGEEISFAPGVVGAWIERGDTSPIHVGEVRLRGQ